MNKKHSLPYPGVTAAISTARPLRGVISYSHSPSAIQLAAAPLMLAFIALPLATLAATVGVGIGSTPLPQPINATQAPVAQTAAATDAVGVGSTEEGSASAAGSPDSATLEDEEEEDPFRQSGLTNEQRQEIVDLHNFYRAELARGHISGHPEAANLMPVEWDDRLASEAQLVTNACSQNADYLTTMPKVGKVYVLSSYNSNKAFKKKKRNFFKNEIDSWFSGFDKHLYPGNCLEFDHECRRFEQIGSQFLYRMGCGFSRCLDHSAKFVCIFFKTHEPSLQLYKRGPVCSSCQVGQAFCLDDALCASERQCEIGRSVNSCRCTVNRDVCLANGGQYNESACVCRCPVQRTGVNCQESCIRLKTNKQMPLNVEYCSETCSWCPNRFYTSHVYNRYQIRVNTEANSNVIKRPLLNEMPNQDPGCADSRDECPDWAKAGYCSSQTVIDNCQLSCNSCSALGEQENPQTAQPTPAAETQLIVQTVAMIEECVDKHSSCSYWAQNQANCQSSYLKDNCQKSCGFCKSQATTELASVDPCYQPDSRMNTCEMAKNAGQCTISSIIEHCPIDCAKPGCVSTSAPPTLLGCYDEDTNCPGWATAGISYCLNEYVKQKCKKSCKLCTEQPDVSKDPQDCLTLKQLCNNANVKQLCPNMCKLAMKKETLTTALPPTTTQMQQTDPATCADLKNMCHVISIKSLCPKTCTIMETTTTITAPVNTDPLTCVDLKNMCHVPSIKSLCANTCALPTTTAIPIATVTENVACPTLKGFCFQNPSIRALCPLTCTVTTTTPYPTTTTTKQMENAACSGLIALCSLNPSIPLLCPVSCGTTTAAPTTTVTLPMITENAVCPSLAQMCSISATILQMCPLSCATTPSTLAPTTSTTTQMPVQSEPVFCPIASDKCDMDSIRQVCVITCAVTEPVQVDPPVCRALTNTCQEEYVQSLCPMTCSMKAKTTTAPIPTTTSVQQTDPPVCVALVNDCKDEKIWNICPLTCSVKTTNAVTTTTTATTTMETTEIMTENPICKLLSGKDCCNEALKSVCTETCAAVTTISTINTTTTEPIPLSTEPLICVNLKSQCDQNMIKSICPNTCVSGADSCDNLYDNVAMGICSARSEQGECKSNSGWMSIYCKRACGLCSVPTIKTIY